MTDLRERNEKLAGQIEGINAELAKKQKLLKDLQRAIKAEERRERTHNLCIMGGLVYKYFGDNISPEEFETILKNFKTTVAADTPLETETEVTYDEDNDEINDRDNDTIGSSRHTRDD